MQLPTHLVVPPLLHAIFVLLGTSWIYLLDLFLSNHYYMITEAIWRYFLWSMA